jgi:hypothetical protein
MTVPTKFTGYGALSPETWNDLKPVCQATCKTTLYDKMGLTTARWSSSRNLLKNTTLTSKSSIVVFVEVTCIPCEAAG